MDVNLNRMLRRAGVLLTLFAGAGSAVAVAAVPRPSGTAWPKPHRAVRAKASALTVPLPTTPLPTTTPTVPVSTPTVPVKTPTVPVKTPTVPVTTPTVPVTTPTVPVKTPTVPVKTPSVPVTAPSAPVRTPSVTVKVPSAPATPIKGPSVTAGLPAAPPPVKPRAGSGQGLPPILPAPGSTGSSIRRSGPAGERAAPGSQPSAPGAGSPTSLPGLAPSAAGALAGYHGEDGPRIAREITQVLKRLDGAPSAAGLRRVLEVFGACLPSLTEQAREVVALRSGLRAPRPVSVSGTARRLRLSSRRVLALENAAVRRLLLAAKAGGCAPSRAGGGLAGLLAALSLLPTSAHGGVAGAFYLSPASDRTRADRPPLAAGPGATPGSDRGGASPLVTILLVLAGVAAVTGLSAQSLGVPPPAALSRRRRRRGRRPRRG